MKNSPKDDHGKIAIIFLVYGMFLALTAKYVWGQDFGFGGIFLFALLLILSILFSIIISIWGWRRLTYIEVGFLLSFVGNLFVGYGFGLISHPVDYLSIFIGAIILAAPMGLFYLVKIIRQVIENDKNKINNYSTYIRFVGVALFILAVYLISQKLTVGYWTF